MSQEPSFSHQPEKSKKLEEERWISRVERHLKEKNGQSTEAEKDQANVQAATKNTI